MNMFSPMCVSKAEEIAGMVASMPTKDAIEILNKVRLILHEVSPFRGEPVDCVLWVEADKVRANDYNPNTVAPPEMRLLEESIHQDGYTQPVVAWEKDGYEVVDGFHRTRVAKESRKVRERVMEHIPVTVIKDERVDLPSRMAATIRHNRARGVHGVIPMTDIVSTMLKNGCTDQEVAKALGMDADEVLRFKQHSGLPELFKDHDYSRSWE